ncbi:MAG: thiamine phosphate synthase [Deltaproteobacteria bacterium]|nr:thiamine phosphate synthase [Deltaproteobacteria bacterium]
MTPIAGLYTIVDPRFLPPSMEVATYLAAVLRGGCRVVQLRVKPSSVSGDPQSVQHERETCARVFAQARRQCDFTWIMNDDVTAACAFGADGIHVGADDPRVDAVRATLGQGRLVGYSAHSLEEAQAAEAAGADYVAFGAIYPTTTKGPGHPVQGLERLRRVVRAVSIPVVAIGGITRERVAAVRETGAAAVALITGISGAVDVCREVAWYVGQ